MENEYLQGLVGDALARGCAATITAQPNDAVEYLALWLLRYVKNAEIEGEFYKDKQDEIDAKKAALEASLLAHQQAVTVERTRAADLEELANMEGEPRQLLQAAVDLIKKHTSAASVYAANLADPEQPDWTPPEDLEDPNYESEDEVEAPVVEGEEGEAAAEPEPEAAEEPVEDAEPPPPIPKRHVDYSAKYLSYIATSPGQEFISTLELRKPPPPPEDADDEFVQPPVPTTFKILADRQPLLYVPNVAFDPAIKFFRELPKIGAYIAAAVRINPLEKSVTIFEEPVFCSVLAADSLFPEGHGQELSKEEQDFVWETSIAVGKAMDRILQQSHTVTNGDSALGAQQLATLKTQVTSVAVKHREAVAAIEEPPAPEEVDPEAEEAAAAEVDADGEGPSPDVVVEQCIAKVEALKVALTHSKWKATVAASRLEQCQAVHALVVQAMSAVQERAIFAVHHTLSIPQATFHVLKALLLLLGETPAEAATWKHVQGKVDAALFERAAAFDATAPRNMEVWKQVLASYRAVANPKDLETEFPSSCLGAIILKLIKQIRKTANRAAENRAAVQKVSDQEEQLVKAQAAVVAAEEAKVAAEAKAEQDRLDAEAAAEAEAAAAAAEEAAAAAGEEEADE